MGFANALAAPETAWSLLESGAKVTVFARRGTRTALRQCRELTIVEITPVEEDAGRAVAEVAELLRLRPYTALMPLDDASVWLCGRVAESDLGSVSIVGPTGAQAALALDKGLQVEAAERAGFSVPATRHVQYSQEIRALTGLPLVLKPAYPVRMRSGRLVRGGNYVCGNRDELERVAGSWHEEEPLLAQPLLRGVGEGLFGLAGPDGLMALSAHRRIRMANPGGSGSSACASIPVDGDLARAAERMLRDVGWRGMFMLEFLRDADGTAWFMELNGRPWGSMALARRAGLEYPAWALRQSDDPEFAPPPTGPFRPQTCRHLGREIVHLLMVLRGPRSVAQDAWPSRWRTVRDVVRIGREDQWYNWRRKDWRLFVEDAVRTVLVQLREALRP
jgi:predicted ATP-grasp superfamily ATP-dependent carboligase